MKKSRIFMFFLGYALPSSSYPTLLLGAKDQTADLAQTASSPTTLSINDFRDVYCYLLKIKNTPNPTINTDDSPEDKIFNWTKLYFTKNPASEKKAIQLLEEYFVKYPNDTNFFAVPDTPPFNSFLQEVDRAIRGVVDLDAATASKPELVGVVKEAFHSKFYDREKIYNLINSAKSNVKAILKDVILSESNNYKKIHNDPCWLIDGTPIPTKDMIDSAVKKITNECPIVETIVGKEFLKSQKEKLDIYLHSPETTRKKFPKIVQAGNKISLYITKKPSNESGEFGNLLQEFNESTSIELKNYNSQRHDFAQIEADKKEFNYGFDNYIEKYIAPFVQKNYNKINIPTTKRLENATLKESWVWPATGDLKSNLKKSTNKLHMYTALCTISDNLYKDVQKKNKPENFVDALNLVTPSKIQQRGPDNGTKPEDSNFQTLSTILNNSNPSVAAWAPAHKVTPIFESSFKKVREFFINFIKSELTAKKDQGNAYQYPQGLYQWFTESLQTAERNFLNTNIFNHQDISKLDLAEMKWIVDFAQYVQTQNSIKKANIQQILDFFQKKVNTFKAIGVKSKEDLTNKISEIKEEMKKRNQYKEVETSLSNIKHFLKQCENDGPKNTSIIETNKKIELKDIADIAFLITVALDSDPQMQAYVSTIKKELSDIWILFQDAVLIQILSHSIEAKNSGQMDNKEDQCHVQIFQKLREEKKDCLSHLLNIFKRQFNRVKQDKTRQDLSEHIKKVFEKYEEEDNLEFFSIFYEDKFSQPMINFIKSFKISNDAEFIDFFDFVRTLIIFQSDALILAEPILKEEKKKRKLETYLQAAFAAAKPTPEDQDIILNILLKESQPQSYNSAPVKKHEPITTKNEDVQPGPQAVAHKETQTETIQKTAVEMQTDNQPAKQVVDANTETETEEEVVQPVGQAVAHMETQTNWPDPAFTQDVPRVQRNESSHANQMSSNPINQGSNQSSKNKKKNNNKSGRPTKKKGNRNRRRFKAGKNLKKRKIKRKSSKR